MSLRELAASVLEGRRTATAVVEQTLAKIKAENGAINAFTAVTEDRALADAAAVDAAAAVGRDPGPLAGVPFAVKNLYDVAGLPTVAGSRIDRDRAPAVHDAALVRRLTEAGAVLVGALNMDEYAFGFSTENTHYGATRNPHDPTRIAGGSSGGSAAAVAASLIPLSLGSDTNGSIRVPAALCGVFGLRPTHGRLSRTGMRLFAASLDVGGPFARSAEDLALAYDALQGHDPSDAASAARPSEPVSPALNRGVDGIRIAVASGYFASQGTPEAMAAVERVAAALGVGRRVELPAAGVARAAAMVVTSVEGAELHLPDLIARAGEFDPKTRARFLAGALAPGAWYAHAQRFRRAWSPATPRKLFETVDVILAPSTPYPAFPIGQAWMEVNGARLPAAGHLGVYTQPLSFAGLPTVAAPVASAGALPLGVQIVAAPWREDLAFRVAAAAEALGVVGSAPVTPV